MYKSILSAITCAILAAGCVNISRTDKQEAGGMKNAVNESVAAAPLKWESTGILINPKSDDAHKVASIKDPTVVYYDGKWHVYATVFDTTANTYNMAYVSFSDWSKADSAAFRYMDSNPSLKGYKCAPQVFFFEPQKKWYLIYQSQPPTYSTAAEIGEPSNWSAPQFFYASKPKGAPDMWIDYWVICDSGNAYMFFSGDDGKLYRSRTALKDFPNGFGEVTTVMEFPQARDLFEACNVYKIKGTDKYLLLNECADANWTRYFKAFISDSLTGTWYELAASDSNPFCGLANVTFESGVSPWTRDFSHGELLRAGYDQTMTIDGKSLRFLYQGKTGNAAGYNLIPWSLGILNQVSPPDARSIFDVTLANLKPYARAAIQSDRSGDVQGNAGNENVLVVELESLSGQPGFSPFAVVRDPAASGGAAIGWQEEGSEQHVAEPADGVQGQVSIPFILSEPASVRLQVQVNMPNADDDSFYYKMDSGSWNTQNNATTTGFRLLTLSPFSDLPAGKHTLSILRRENGALLDKVMIMSSAAIQAIVLNEDFENKETGNWTKRGSAVLSMADTDAHQGKYCLLTTNRTAGWNGPQIDLTGKIFPTGIYEVSAWVKIREGDPAAEMIMTVQKDKSGKSSWNRVTALKTEPGSWVNLSGEYEVKDDFDKIAVYIESSNATGSYCIDDLIVSVVKEPSSRATGKDLPSLSETYKDYFSIGTAVELSQLKGEEKELLLRHFSSLTAENIMKPQYLSPSEGRYFFDQADQLVNFALENNRLLRGHSLLWHGQNARWMFTDEKGAKVSRNVLLARLENYIKTVVTRYKGKVYAWDVVNEAVDDKGLRRSEWLDIIGEDYIEKAFAYAREADPDARLFINEYDTTDKVKGEILYNLVKKLRDKKVPVDGVGMQFHISLEYPAIRAIADSLEKWNELGVEIHITELDMSLNSDATFNPDKLPEDLAVRQAYRYKQLFDTFKQYKNITNVTFWGFNDGHTWLHTVPYKKADWPLLFDADLNAKYAYWGLVDPSVIPENVVAKKEKNNFLATAGKGTPVIDGKEDAVWGKAQAQHIAVYALGNGAKGTGRILWDEKGLYVFIKVLDARLSRASANAYEQDSVEIFIDERNDKTVDYGEDDAQYRINFENEKSSGGFPADIKSATEKTWDGYTIEVSIPFKSIKGSPGLKIGFDLQVNDDDGSGKRTSIAKWNDPTNDSYRNTSNFGTLILGE